SKGVIHRDLKPLNVMVGAFGEVQVMDWGLAKVLKEEAPPTPTLGAAESVVQTDRENWPDEVKTGVLGTPQYMPPEQARGEVEQIDRRCDVFSVGAILCEIPTGQPPYVGTVKEVLAHAQVGFLHEAHKRLQGCVADGELIGLAQSCLSARA